MDDTFQEALALARELGAEDRARLAAMLDHSREESPGGDIPPGGVERGRFVVPDTIRHLSSPQLEFLSRAAEKWVDEAAAPQTRRARKRMRMLFLFLRYSGVRLGEALALDDVLAFDFKRMSVRFPGNENGSGDREVLLPEGFVRELAIFLDDPDVCALRGKVFQLDPGFVRKKFYELADMAGLPRDMVNPSTLRNSRAVELLRAGVPLLVLQNQLGWANLLGPSGYCVYPDDMARRILSQCIQKEFRMRSSARNTFTGLVEHVAEGGIMSEVTVRTDGGFSVVSLITMESKELLGISEGAPLTVMVKAPWILVSKDQVKAETSARNAFPATVLRVRGDDLAVEVIGELADGTTMCALITDTSVEKLALAPGDRVHFFFKALNVILTSD